MTRKKRIADVLNGLADEEEQFLEREFLAPVVRGRKVRVRLAGVVCEIEVRPKDFEGFGVFHPRSFEDAELVRAATLAERQRYLRLFPLVRLVLCRREEGRWLAFPAHRGDARFEIRGPVPVELVVDAQSFDTIVARFDGATFWFEEIEGSRDPATAAYLRRSLEDRLDPEELSRLGLTPEERATYAIQYVAIVGPIARPDVSPDGTKDGTKEERGDPVEARLRASLAHAGARFLDYLEHRDSYRVTYTVDGSRQISSVAKSDLTVLGAGICLDGRDGDFDLDSLVGVLREGRERGEIYEEDY